MMKSTGDGVSGVAESSIKAGLMGQGLMRS